NLRLMYYHGTVLLRLQHPAPSAIYTPSLHDALPIWTTGTRRLVTVLRFRARRTRRSQATGPLRPRTRRPPRAPTWSTRLGITSAEQTFVPSGEGQPRLRPLMRRGRVPTASRIALVITLIGAAALAFVLAKQMSQIGYAGVDYLVWVQDVPANVRVEDVTAAVARASSGSGADIAKDVVD